MKFELSNNRLDVWVTADEYAELAVNRFIQSQDTAQTSERERFPLQGIFVASTTKELSHEPAAILSKEGLRLIVSRVSMPVVIPGHKIERPDGTEGLSGGVMFHFENYRSDLPADC